MKKIGAMMLVVLIGAPFAQAAQHVQIGVKGMVCSFCAQGIKKKLSSEDAVQNVEVNLDAHQVSVDLKEGANLSDEKLTQILTDSGYAVEGIKR